MTSACLRTMTQRHSYVRISITPTTAMVTRIATRGAVASTNAKYCTWWRHVRGVYRDQYIRDSDRAPGYHLREEKEQPTADDMLSAHYCNDGTDPHQGTGSGSRGQSASPGWRWLEGAASRSWQA